MAERRWRLSGQPLNILAWTGCSALGAYVAILWLKSHLAHRYAARQAPYTLADEPVTVLQPILSGDPALERVLATNLHVTTPNTFFCWLIDEEDVVARQVADRLSSAFPRRIKTIFCPPPPPAVNPKTAKLDRGLAEVATANVAVLDDDTMLDAGSIPRGIARLGSCTLYTGLPRYIAKGGIWSSLLAHFVNNNSILTYLPMAHLGEPVTINGMFYVMRTKTLHEQGGFAPILSMLCDDYALARHVKSTGGTIHQSIAPQALRTTLDGPGHYLRIMHRWMLFARQLMSDQPIGVNVRIAVLLGLPPMLLWLGMLSFLGGLWFWGLVPAVLVFRHRMLGELHRTFFGEVRDFSAWVSVVAELLQPLHLVHACIVRTIRWRTRRIRANTDGTFCFLAGTP